MTRDQAIADAREKLEDLTKTFSADDFARVCTKFFSALIITETHFKRRFPEEHAKWEKEYYGEDDGA